MKNDVNYLGLTQNEQKVMQCLTDCHKAFLELKSQHPDEMRDFVDGVHRIQDVLALRIVRRAFPLGWPVYKVKSERKEQRKVGL